MAQPKRLARAPIVEALINISFDVRDDFDASSLVQLGDMLVERFGGCRRHDAEQTTIVWNQGDKDFDVSREAKIFDKVVLARDNVFVQIRRTAITISHVKNYGAWEDLVSDARDAFEAYVNFVHPNCVKRVASKFINQITLPREIKYLDECFVIGPQLPAELGLDIAAFQFATMWKNSSTDVTGKLVLKSLRGRSVEFDIDAEKAVDLPTDFDAIFPVLTEIREQKNGVFFGSLTDKALGLFQ